MQNQECSESIELLVKKGLTQKDTPIHALIRVSSSSQCYCYQYHKDHHYYIEHPIELSNLPNVSECYE